MLFHLPSSLLHGMCAAVCLTVAFPSNVVKLALKVQRWLLLQDLVRQICVTIADHGAADFAVGSLIIELISSDGNWEAIMIGLKALLSIFMTAPARAAGKQASGIEVCAACLSQGVYSRLTCDRRVVCGIPTGACAMTRV